MSEFSMSRTKKTGLSSFLLSDLFKFCFFALSHPLYFSYFIFFSPYLFKLLSFLSPLFITTTLLLLAFLTTLTPSFVEDDSHSDDLPEHKAGFLSSTYQTVLERLRSEVDDDDKEFRHFEELEEVFKIVFDTSTLEVREDPAEVLEEVVKETCLETSEAPVDKCSIHESKATDLSNEDGNGDSEQNLVEISQTEIMPPIMELESLKWCLEEEKELEKMSCKKEDKEVNPWTVESDKVEPEPKEQLFIRSGSKVIGINKIKDDKASNTNNYFAGPDYDLDQFSLKADMEDSQTFASNLGSFGSMRKEKEWRRTLACKLFEERHNVDGGEGMDMLWETYETESNKPVLAKNNTKKGKKGVLEYNDDDDDDYEDETDGQLCCLQALKFSAGKMNLGMGRPNLVKISKALKGMGWLQHVTRHGKKRYN